MSEPLPVIADSYGRPATCGACIWWIRQINPVNLGLKVGQCRCEPPSVTVVLDQLGRARALSAYPELPADFPACGEFRELSPRVPQSPLPSVTEWRNPMPLDAENG